MSDDTELPDLRYVRELAKVFKQYGLDEIELETGGARILLRRGGGGEPIPVALSPAPSPVAVAAPFVGTFYNAPRPDADSFVKVGQTISAGETVCIVEAMKLFNEIETEFPCIIEEMLVDNAQPVEYGAKLFRVRRL
jgi:hypothetical protein